MWQLKALVGGLIFSVVPQLIAVATATPWWLIVSVDGDSTNAYIGLWQLCVETDCVGIPPNIGLEFMAIRGLEVCGFILALVALTVGSRVLCFIMDNSPIRSNLVGFPVLSLVAGSCSIIGCGIYGLDTVEASSIIRKKVSSSIHVRLHVSFVLAVIAASVQVILGIIGLVLGRRHFNAGAPPTQRFTEFHNVDITPTVRG